MLPPRAYVFIGLNGVRVLSIIACLLVFSSSIVTMVHDVEAVNNFVAAGRTNSTSADGLLNCDYIADSTVPNQPAGAFWAVLNRLLIIFQVIVLILSEIGWPLSFFNRFFPVLGSDFGLGALGVVQCLIGAAILSHHVDDFALVSAFFLFSIGCLNILLGLIFREGAKGKRSLTSWREQAKGVLPPPVQRAASSASTLYGAAFSEKGAGNESSERFAGFGFGRQGEKKAGLKGFLISKPIESLPRYAPSNRARASTPAGV
ncbi:hypothetical protein B0F90DRAFT_1818345 [Multifurca ochricompacta]|uniref:DUF7598 domain-containing protein n=1 Tax=Multifurca ochricompacta TaxID=376703 RepID=A0AAD4QLE0_9AGAM|nr:hypothetical protein B0F90DRAFT_1818345 [Multifurca ochricompacta]